MINFELGGYYFDYDRRVQLPLITQPSIVQIMNYLNILKTHNGILVLDNDQEDNQIPYKLTLYSDSGFYMVLLETMMDDGDLDIRTFYNKSESKKFISILGEPYSEASIVKEFDLVIEVVKEFYETGNVSTDLLN
ncbi:DUF6911 family protein [Yersinia enterocolitica]|jgi:hypothetical protein|uniref:CdiI immunity protein domain-containing protein n=1 Tax=Yersinia intermedia TaxID=631 RepID=A0ABX6F8C1_YERIN|nr:hypothetical protein [Yersinia intermedia]HDL7645703.1 hypothetical protein [Yersinia enterocolitica]AJJ20641.1 hypothetical protein CH53_3111 [Yersinia intermedia]MDA5511604.1 hypothetical protein [Yersinia intermedia]MDN0117128.1 hypothetical protein [Yersinia intermedia]OVZ72970.1 hypothetical protein CBW55_22680 [Yersinia intermedia]